MADTPATPWPQGKRVAVSLSFDDARYSQTTTGVPLLDRAGAKATFYVSLSSFHRFLGPWREAAAAGHEIGNHAVHHACSANFAWSAPHVLEDYTLEQMAGELSEASAHIREGTGREPLTFAYPCGQMYVGRGAACQSYIPLVARLFLAGRGWRDEHYNDPHVCDLARLAGTESDGRTFDDLRTIVEDAARQGAWVVFAGHEIGAGGRQTTIADALTRLCEYAQDPANGVWLDTVATVAAAVKAFQDGHGGPARRAAG